MNQPRDNSPIKTITFKATKFGALVVLWDTDTPTVSVLRDIGYSTWTGEVTALQYALGAEGHIPGQSALREEERNQLIATLAEFDDVLDAIAEGRWNFARWDS